MILRAVLRSKRPKYSARPFPVTKTFREQVIGTLMAYGAEPDDHSLLRFIEDYLWGTFREGGDGALIVPHKKLAVIEGVRYTTRYNGSKFLERISPLVGGMVIEEHRYSSGSLRNNGRARSIVSIGCEAQLRELLDEEYKRKPATEDLVDFVSGKPWNRPARRKAVQEEVELLSELLSGSKLNPDSLLIAEYIHDLGRYRETYYAKVVENIFEANEALLEVYKPEPGASLEAKEERWQQYCQQRKILDRIKAHPVPFVQPAEQSSRLAPCVNGYVTLKREAYKELIRGWEQFDAAAIQLAIVAKLWDIPELQEFLAGGEYIWQRLCDDVGIPLSEKHCLKEATYKLFFGARMTSTSEDEATQRSSVFGGLELRCGGGVARKFVNHPLIRPIVKARKRMKAKIEKDGGIGGAHGWIALERSTHSRGGATFEKSNWRSVLALQAQSYEVALISECYRVAKETSDFIIAVYKYDGFCICWKDTRPERREKWITRLTEAFDAKAKELGIHTRLVCEGE